MTHEEHVAAARDGLLSVSDREKAIALANRLSEIVTDHLNDAHVGAGTALLARAIALGAITNVGAAWWTDMMPDVPRPVTAAALRSITADPPLWLNGADYTETDEEERIRRGKKP